MKHDVYLLMIQATCWQCDKDMFVALIGDEDGDFVCGPESFSDEQIELAEKSGALIKSVYSKTCDETYCANVCKNCNAFVGKFYFFAHYYAPALRGDYKYSIVAVV